MICVFVKKETMQGNPATVTDILPLMNPNPLIDRFCPPVTYPVL